MDRWICISMRVCVNKRERARMNVFEWELKWAMKSKWFHRQNNFVVLFLLQFQFEQVENKTSNQNEWTAKIWKSGRTKQKWRVNAGKVRLTNIGSKNGVASTNRLSILLFFNLSSKVISYARDDWIFKYSMGDLAHIPFRTWIRFLIFDSKLWFIQLANSLNVIAICCVVISIITHLITGEKSHIVHQIIRTIRVIKQLRWDHH